MLVTCARVPVQLPAGSRSALGPSQLYKMCAAAQRRRPTCARPGAAAATCSRCWRCWPWPCGQLPVGVRCLEATPSWSTAAVPRRTSGAVAQPQCSQSCATAEPVQPEHVYSMLMHGCGRVVSQSEAVTCTDTTTVDTFIRPLYSRQKETTPVLGGTTPLYARGTVPFIYLCVLPLSSEL